MPYHGTSGCTGDEHHNGRNRRVLMRGGMRAANIFTPQSRLKRDAPSAVFRDRPLQTRVFGGENWGDNDLIPGATLGRQFQAPEVQAPPVEEGAAGGGADEGQLVVPEPPLRPFRELFPPNTCFTMIIPFLSYYYPEFAALRQEFSPPDAAGGHDDDLDYEEDEDEEHLGGAVGKSNAAFAPASASGALSAKITPSVVAEKPAIVNPEEHYVFVSNADLLQLQFIRKNRSTSSHPDLLYKFKIVKDFMETCRATFQADVAEPYFFFDLDEELTVDKRRERAQKLKVKEVTEDEVLLEYEDDDYVFSYALHDVQRNHYSGIIYLTSSSQDMRTTAVEARRHSGEFSHVIPFVSPPGSNCIYFFDSDMQHGLPLMALDVSRADVEPPDMVPDGHGLFVPKEGTGKPGLAFLRNDFLRLMFPGHTANYLEEGLMASHLASPARRFDFYVHTLVVLEVPAQILPKQLTLISRHTGALTMFDFDDEELRERQLKGLARADDLLNQQDTEADLRTVQPLGRAALGRHFFQPPELQPTGREGDVTEEDWLARPDLARRLIYGGRAIDVINPYSYNIDLGEPTNPSLLARLQTVNRRKEPHERTISIYLIGDIVVSVDVVDGIDVPSTRKVRRGKSLKNAKDLFFLAVRQQLEKGYYLLDPILVAEPDDVELSPEGQDAPPQQAGPAAAGALPGVQGPAGPAAAGALPGVQGPAGPAAAGAPPGVQAPAGRETVGDDELLDYFGINPG